jgi:LmbE family N-acetylglucosaminyl deacetylase
MNVKLLSGLLALIPFFSFAQYGNQLSSAEILHELKKLNTVGKVLYIAAHPDDENTRLIAHLANRERVDVAYLSLTRGDGGQNLIGTEIGVELGLIRTQELLAARRIDGGEQYFSRALDFGYSKSADESFDIWGKDEIMSDMVWVIRQFQPDIIINRFSHDDPRGHGHHTASAMLSVEAFDLAADPSAFPEQLDYVKPWQAGQIWHNVSTWWDKTLPDRAKEDPSIISFEVSDFETLLGRSIGEVASLSRSQHRSQGFGTTLQRGSSTEYLQFLKGETHGETLFSPDSKSWNRLKGGKEVGQLIEQCIAQFDPTSPEKSIASLIEIARAVEHMPENRFREKKLAHVQELIAQCAGLWIEATSAYDQVLPGAEVKVDMSFLNRSEASVTIKGFLLNNLDTTFNHSLLYNRTHLIPCAMQVSANHPYTEQYWLTEPPINGRFVVDDQLLRGTPESDWPFSAEVSVSVSDYDFSVRVPVIHKWADRAKGEQMRLLKVVPPLTVNPSEPLVISANQQEVEVKVRLRAHSDKQKGSLRPEMPAGWRCEPEVAQFELNRRSEEEVLTFKLSAGPKAQTGTLKWVAETTAGRFSQSEKEIDYDHIPVQPLLYPAEMKAVSFELKTVGKRVGYLEGSGDDVPKALQAMGYQVDMLTPEDIGSRNLSVYDAIITGIRAYNVQNNLPGVNHRLHKYVADGGNLIVQYNVAFGLVTEDIAPFPFIISRNRVTDETAKPTFVNKKHPLLNHPNKLTLADFDDWVQERGLYFADDWDEAFSPVISWNDPDEDPHEGALIVAQHGKGNFIYTGISFFRQLPAGVPGAYRLMANLIACGKDGR